MQTLTVLSRQHEYPIYIDADICLKTHLLPFIKGKQVLIVTNTTVAPLYLSWLVSALVNYDVKVCELADGEAFKNQSSINHIYDTLMQASFNRDCTLIALGGGVIGDMTGFAAASFMRGVNFIQIPTTLLSQVDSSVGGKTGINHPMGKNMIGAFWQPQVVIAQINTLQSLPDRELSAGLAEVIKYALITDHDFLRWLERNMPALRQKNSQLLSEAVYRSCEHKAKIVAQDEFEAGKRALLNFGHTFGHVIEAHQGYGQWLHGEAVAVGMLQAAQLSALSGWLSVDDVNRIRQLLTCAGLPTEPPAIPLSSALTLMQHDKKVKDGKIRLILLKRLGEAFISDEYDASLLSQVLTG